MDRARELANDRAMANAERAWLEPPDDHRPTGVEDAEGMVIMFPETWEPGTTIEEVVRDWGDGVEENPTDEDLFGIIDGFETWEEAEGDGEGGVSRYGGVTLMVQSLTSKRQCSVELDKVHEYTVPVGLRGMAEAAEKVRNAEAAAWNRRYEYERCWPSVRRGLQARRGGR